MMQRNETGLHGIIRRSHRKTGDCTLERFAHLACAQSQSLQNVRLRQIRLAGFKSFVDPTPIDVPGTLVGVVGPNGCGKSNVIDAVRWVLGESKAAELRGESMQDVIFNGSGDRKPAGRASVELAFDNRRRQGTVSVAHGRSTPRFRSSVC